MEKLTKETEQIMNERFGKDNVIAMATVGDWFTAKGKGVNLGYFGKPENAGIARMLRDVFVEWIDNGHNNFADENTVILKIELIEGVLFSQGKRYHIDFAE